MPSPIHDFLAEWIGYDIMESLRRARDDIDDNAVVAVLEGIDPSGTTSIPLRRQETKSPDKGFQHADCEDPSLVIEVGWSQDELDMAWKAERYIKGSKGGVRTVVGVSLNNIYKSSKSKRPRKSKEPRREIKTSQQEGATFSVWRADIRASIVEKPAEVSFTESILNKVRS